MPGLSLRLNDLDRHQIHCPFHACKLEYQMLLSSCDFVTCRSICSESAACPTITSLIQMKGKVLHNIQAIFSIGSYQWHFIRGWCDCLKPKVLISPILREPLLFLRGCWSVVVLSCCIKLLYLSSMSQVMASIAFILIWTDAWSYEQTSVILEVGA